MSAPVYVKVEKYKRVHMAISKIKKRVDDAKEVLKRIIELKAEEEHEINAWQQEFEKIESKVEFIENSLSKPGDIQ